MNDTVGLQQLVEHDPFSGPELSAFGPVTESQSEIWLASALDEDANRSYNEGIALHLRGALDVQALAAALQTIVDRHDALRGNFSSDGRWMSVRRHLPVELPQLDLRRETDVATALRRHEQRCMAQAFDLESDALLRFLLIRTADTEHELLLVAHHIVCDGWSSAQMLVEIGALYSEQVGGAPAALSTAPRFGDYSEQERAFHASEEGRRHFDYWLRQLEGAPAPIALPSDRPRRENRSFTAGRLDYPLTQGTVTEVRAFAARQGASLVMTLLAAFTAELHRLTGVEDCVIGLAAAGQSLHEQVTLVGHCVNFLPLRLRPRGAEPFAALLRQTRQVVLDAYEHQGVTYGSLLPHLGLERDPGAPPLISIAFNIDVRDDDIAHRGLDVRYRTLARCCEVFELFVNIVDNGRDLIIECSYQNALFDEARITAMMQAFEARLRGLATNLDRPLAEGCTESPTNSSINHAAATSLHDRILQVAARQPQAVAVSCDGRSLSFAELDARSAAVAARLMALGIAPGDRVALCLPRQLEVPIAVLGILRAGAAYVPVDPDLPLARRCFMLDDAGVRVLIVDRINAEDSIQDPMCQGRTAVILAECQSAGPVHFPRVSAEQAAYVIYTSGSTGQPKGVVAHHAGVLNCIEGTQQRVPLEPGGAVLAIATFAFDASVLELFFPLATGARLVIASSEETVDGHRLARLIEREGITHLFTAPAAWRLLLAAGWSGAPDMTGISWAEPLSADLAAALIPRLKTLWNFYGPTETTVWMLGARIVDAQRIHIGTPIPGTQAWVLDEQQRPLPPGREGELYLGGAGVALGYLNRPELTRERFLEGLDLPGAQRRRVYRSGDLARVNADGQIECLGRIDAQVKLRGYRIELGEIETALRRHPEIADAAVGVREREPGDARLVAWLQPQSGRSAPGLGTVRAMLREQLPAYMVPQHVVALPALPRLPNGKLDRRALPSPYADPTAMEARPNLAVQPPSATEAALLRIWSELLDHQEIRIGDRFLDVGGHSLLAVQVAGRIREQFGVKLPLRSVLTEPLAVLARACEPAQPEAVACEDSEPGTTEHPADRPRGSWLRRWWTGWGR